MTRRAAVAFAGLVSLGGAAAAADNVYAGTSAQLRLDLASGTENLRRRLAERSGGRAVGPIAFFGPTLALWHVAERGHGVGVAAGPLLVGRGGDTRRALLPLAATLRVEPFRIPTHATFVVLGVERVLVHGDGLAGGRSGAVFGFGVDYLKPAGIGWGMQAGLHTATVRVQAGGGLPAEDARPARVRFGGFYRF